MPERPPEAGRGLLFQKTRWSLILRAGSGTGDDARRAMEELLNAYQYPLYCYLRRWGLSPEEARDERQDFFVHVLEHSVIQAANPSRGRFRSFILKCLKNHLENQERRKKSATPPRGVVSLDELLDDDERRSLAEPSSGLTPEEEFETNWAHSVVRRAIEVLQKEYEGRGEPELFKALLPVVYGDPTAESYKDIASRLGRQEQALRTAASRLRDRIGDRVRNLVSDTVHRREDIDAELQLLMKRLGRHSMNPL